MENNSNNKGVLSLLESNLGGIVFVVIPTITFYITTISDNFNTIENKINSMQRIELIKIILTIFVMFISWLFLLVIRLRIKLRFIVDYADLLREDASEINNYISHCSENRIKQIQEELQKRGIIPNELPNVITEEEKRLHNELCKKRLERQIELYETITNKKYEPNRD